MRIGIDTGGTFTDLVCWREGHAPLTLKLPSTPHDPSRAVLDGIAQLLELTGEDGSAVRQIVHGTTVATNAVLERKGATTGIIATQGFKDVLEIGRQLRQQVYELKLAPQTPTFLAPGRRRVEVRERTAANGEVLTPLDETSVRDALAELDRAGVESVAVCLMFSFLNPAHETRIRELAREHAPELWISLSSEVDPAFREYERTVVTAFDAYTKPVLARYLDNIVSGLGELGIQAPLQVMQSRGGVSGAGIARDNPVRLFLSGPAAGVLGGAEAGAAAGERDLITVDVGGTSCDVALVSGGQAATRPEGQVDGYPVRVPMVDVNAIGSGGGSIAWLDPAGGLRVGPHSAGASPGPACYASGGELPTVTDASVVLGYLDPQTFADGRINLDAGRAHQAVREHIAEPLGLSVEQAALGIHTVVNAQMAEALRLVSIRQGFDPRDFCLLAMGGAGPLHAAALAMELGMDTVLVPARPGVLSAEGLLYAPVEHECARGYARTLAEMSTQHLRGVFAELRKQVLALMAREGLRAEQVCIEYRADLCYVGQSHYLEVGMDIEDTDLRSTLREAFLNTHRRVFGYATDAPARIVNLRVVARVNSDLDYMQSSSAESSQMPRQRTRAAYFNAAPGVLPTRVFERAWLGGEWRTEGPAIIEQSDTTTLIPPGWSACQLPDGTLKLTRQRSASEQGLQST